MKNTAINKEIESLKRAERRFLSKYKEKKDTKLDKILAEKIPDKLEETLDKAFAKAFHLIFAKGTTLIEKTYPRKKIGDSFDNDTQKLRVHGRRRDLKRFGYRAVGTGIAHTMASTVAGTAMGIIGVGIPDVAVFTSLLLRNLYEISMRFGYDYTGEEEQKFVLRLIAASLKYGEEMVAADEEINTIITAGLSSDDRSVEELINEAAISLSRALLYMKFLQGIPIVGAVGGASDFIYMERIGDYSALKYRRRFLEDHRNEMELKK